MSGSLKSHPALIQIFAARVKLVKKGTELWAVCPFHPDKNPSLSIGKDKAGEWTYHCFGCGVSGDAIRFVEEFDKVPFKKAKEVIEEVTGGDWEETKKLVDKTFQKLDLGEAKAKTRYKLEEYAKYEYALLQSEEAKEWLFRERGITYDTARALHFGYCKSLSSLNRNYADHLADIADGGWIITPAVEGSDVVCIELRSMVRKEFSRKTGMETKTLFGVDFVSPSEPIYVTEGKFDQAVLLQAGFRAISLPNASTPVTPQMRDIIMSASVVILAGDNDKSVGTDRMNKMWAEFRDRTYKLVWPNDRKDANETFLKESNRDVNAFRELVDNLTLQAYGTPLPGIQSMQDILRSDESVNSADRTDRFKFSIPALDAMAIILPGSVVYVSADRTGSGKTQLTTQETIRASMNNGEVVINYQCELGPQEMAEIVTANLMAKDRGEVGKPDKMAAAKRMREAQYYVGSNPDLNTTEGVLDLIEAGVRRVGATVVILDHIHFICQNAPNEIQAQSQAMQRIKRMAQKYHLKFFVIGQPRKPSQKTSGAIDIYDAKGSESIVSSSDVVYLMSRKKLKVVNEGTYDDLSPEVEIRCVKARNRGKGAMFAKLFFLGSIATFNEISYAAEPEMDNRFEF